MATKHQALGNKGENLVKSKIDCPKCKQGKFSLKLLPVNFKCADVICEFCGYLAQVKSNNVKDINVFPRTVLGAAWGPQKERMDAGIFFPLFIVLFSETNSKEFGVYYLSADMQTKEMFVPRKKLSVTAKRAGWQGFQIDFAKAIATPVRLSV